MADTVTITEADMRRALKDDRYWRRGDPERAGYVGWVTDGFRALAGPEARNGTVQVRAYTRMRDGREERVAAHTRSSSSGSSSTENAHDNRAAESDVTPTQALPFLFARPPIVPRLPGAPRTEMRRVPGQSGRESASDVPSFARGFRRYTDETPVQFARRVMDETYGVGRWSGPERARELRQIQKHGSRAFEMPAGIGLLGEQIMPEEYKQ